MKIYFILLLFIFTSCFQKSMNSKNIDIIWSLDDPPKYTRSIAEGHKPKARNNDLHFYDFLKGTRYAIIENITDALPFKEWENNSIEEIVNAEVLKYYNIWLIKYLKDLGFEDVGFEYSNQAKILRKSSSYSEIAIFHLIVDADPKNDKLKITFEFKSVNDDEKFSFSSQTVKYKDYMYFASDSWSGIVRLLYETYSYRKPTFDRSFSIPLLSENSKWNEKNLMTYFDKNNIRGIEGIYEKIGEANSTTYNEAKYKFGVISNNNNEYDVIYISGAKNQDDWMEGEIKAKFHSTGTPNFYKVKWKMTDKSINENVYCYLDENNFLNFKFDGISYNAKYLKLYPVSLLPSNDYETTGTGFAISSNGLIVTNYHVIEHAKDITLEKFENGQHVKLKTTIIIQDKNNDIAILKIKDSRFTSFKSIPFVIKKINSRIGTSVFTLGYPLISTMGNEVKLTDGVISSSTGFEDDITMYQISVPVQPGNSGGPLFDKNGNLLGIVNAKHIGAENVNYAIKVNYLINLLDLLPEKPILSNYSKLTNKNFVDQVDILKDFVFLIKVKK